MLYGIIYKITNLKTNKIYIGQTTTTLEKRWNSHICEAISLKSDYIIHKAIRKYGKKNFTIEKIIDCFDKEDLDNCEIYYINEYISLIPHGYNLQEGGSNGKQTSYTKLKKSISQKLAYKNDSNLVKTRQVGLKRYWQTATEEQLKIRSDKIKQAWTNERRDNMSKIHKGKSKNNSAAVNEIIIPVIVTNTYNGETKEFGSCAEACKMLDLSASAVSNCLKGIRIHHKGYKFYPKLTV